MACSFPTATLGGNRGINPTANCLRVPCTTYHTTLSTTYGLPTGTISLGIDATDHSHESFRVVPLQRMTKTGSSSSFVHLPQHLHLSVHPFHSRCCLSGRLTLSTSLVGNPDLSLLASCVLRDSAKFSGIPAGLWHPGSIPHSLKVDRLYGREDQTRRAHRMVLSLA
jgi:hypothetical protein